MAAQFRVYPMGFSTKRGSVVLLNAKQADHIQRSVLVLCYLFNRSSGLEITARRIRVQALYRIHA